MRTACLTLALSLAVVPIAGAEEAAPAPGVIGQTMAAHAKASATALRGYSWKRRTEIRFGDREPTVKLDLVRYDAAGAQQSTSIGGSEPPPAEKKGRRRGRRGGDRVKAKVVEKKKKEAQEKIQRIVAVAKGQLKPTPELLAGAEPSLRPSGQLRLTATGLPEGQLYELRIDPASGAMRRVEAITDFDGDPLKIRADFADLSDGTTHLARLQIEVPEEEIAITVEELEFTRSE